MLGEFEPVDLRTIWNNEATDFTPWLAKAENLERLSKALGMDLETTEIGRASCRERVYSNV